MAFPARKESPDPLEKREKRDSRDHRDSTDRMDKREKEDWTASRGSLGQKVSPGSPEDRVRRVTVA
jgi:hypothetical protein